MLRRSAWSSLLFCVSWSLAGATTSWAEGRSVGYEARVVLGMPVHVITVNLNAPSVKVSVATAQGFPRGHEPFGRLIGRAAPTAAITGTFFHRSSFHPVGDIVVDGRLRSRGRVGTAMAIMPYNEVSFAPSAQRGAGWWAGYETVLGAGPRLLTDGQVAVNPGREGFRDPHVLGRAPRTAVGVTPNNKLLLVAVQRAVTLTELAKIMRAMGCAQAMNLDGGSSSALYFDGKTLVSPQRPLVNLLVVHENVPLIARTLPPLTSMVRSSRQDWLTGKAAQHFSAAERLMERRASAEAAQHYRSAAYLGDNNASYFIALASALEAYGDAPAAAHACAAAGHILVRKREYRAALLPLTKALALDPFQVSAYDDLAMAYAQVKAEGGATPPAASEAFRLVEEWRKGNLQAIVRPEAGLAPLPREEAPAIRGVRPSAGAQAPPLEQQHQPSAAAAWDDLYVHVTSAPDEGLRRDRDDET